MTIITGTLVGIILYFSRHELERAFALIGQVNIWILLLMVPLQLFVYYCAGEIIFSYLRAKKEIGYVSALRLARMALEMNFVNHVLPSGGVSGISYMTWRLKQHGVSAGKATMAQVVRYEVGFFAFIILLVLAVAVIIVDGAINRWVVLASASLVLLMVLLIVGGIYLFNNKGHIVGFSKWLVRTVNGIVRRVSFGRVRQILSVEEVEGFAVDMHHDFLDLKRDRKILLKPLMWGLLFTFGDMFLFWIAFWALGTPVNPAPIMIAYGIASIAAFAMVTPGGAGIYEAIMVGFLALAGIASGTAIAGIVLARVIILMGTIGFGYIFYQHAIIKYGKHDDAATADR